MGLDLNRHIFLIGLPGTGKSTLGRALAERGFSYVDLDELIENETGSSISDYVAVAGMEAFRRVEQLMLERVCESDPTIVACGGGTPCYSNNLDRMLATGRVIELICSRQRHVNRLIEGGLKRPMFANIVHDADAVARRLDQLAQERAAYYSRAQMQFDASNLESEDEIANTTNQFISLLII